ncbi:hypothetical protein BASA81_003998 [Batrachochytrium salamandrivorans]|nr:hypothetical protein BASA81_003998 [Batrachochytrium salamandrivorans]
MVMSASQVFVGGLDSALPVEEMEELLYELLVQCGEVADVRVPRGEIGNSRGFAFCEFALPEAATYAVLALNGMRMHGRQIRVACAMDDEVQHQVKLGNLPYEMTEIDLYFALSERAGGGVCGVSVLRSKRDGLGEGKAIVWMDSPETALEFARGLQTSPLYFNNIPVVIITV